MEQTNKQTVIFYFLLLLYALFSNYSLGYPPNIYAVVGNFLLLLLAFNLSKYLFLTVLLFHSLICSVYIPEAIFYGSPSVGIIASLFETNAQESWEYLQSLPIYSYVISLLFLLFAIAFAIFALKVKRSPMKKTTVMTLICLITVAVLYKPWSNYHKGKGFQLSDTRVSLIGFYWVNYQLIKEYQRQKAEMSAVKNQQSTWEISAVNPKYKNYVVIIGESMRADYLSMYGYPIETTPFLAKTTGLIIDGYISAAPNTQPSLARTLYLYKENDTQFQNNIITLAKQAGFKTYWLSNQGFSGEFDSVAARVGAGSDKSHFTQLSSDSININDKTLLQIFKTELQESDDKPKLFVLHLMGSHPLFCRRIDMAPSIRFKNDEMSCYLESLRQTDALIKNVVDLVKTESNNNYSLIYFSDHGLSHREKESERGTLQVGNEHKENYQVPFIRISSDDSERKILKTQRSAFNFIYGFAQWLGIQEKTLSNGYQFFSEKPDDVKVFNWHQNIDFNQLPSDPAIVQ